MKCHLRKATVKTISVLLILVFSLAFTGCGGGAGKLIKSITGPSPRELREKTFAMTADATMAIQKKDVDALEKLFCANTKDKSKLSALMGNIHGDYVSSEQTLDYNFPIHFVFDTSDYTIERSEVIGYKTTESLYTIRLVACGNSVFDNNDVGVQYISVYENDTLISEAGKIIERYNEQKIPSKYNDVDWKKLVKEAKADHTRNILYYLASGDADGFAGMFAEQKRAEALEAFNDILAFTGSDLTGYSRIEANGSGGAWRGDHWERVSDDVIVHDLMNKNGEMFEISMYIVFINEDGSESVGIHSFEIRKINPQINDTFGHDVYESLTVSE